MKWCECLKREVKNCDCPAAITTQAARLAEIIVADAATNYAKHLVVALADEFPAIPEWQPLDSLIGILSQIDNMTVGLVSQRDEARARVEALEKALIYVRDSGLLSPLGTAFKTVCAALKAEAP
jgi:hypothetical protein